MMGPKLHSLIFSHSQLQHQQSLGVAKVQAKRHFQRVAIVIGHECHRTGEHLVNAISSKFTDLSYMRFAPKYHKMPNNQ